MHDLFSESRQHAAQIREFFEAYVDSGFTEDQAFALTQAVLRAILGLRG